MPFDGTISDTRLRRERLIDALRRELPNDFEWDFYTIGRPSACGTAGCALGLCKKVFGRPLDMNVAPDFFGLSRAAAEDIFLFHRHRYPVERCEDVTPSMVADALAATIR